MNPEKLLHAIGEISDEFLTEVEELAYLATRRARALKIGIAAAATSVGIAATILLVRAKKARAVA